MIPQFLLRWLYSLSLAIMLIGIAREFFGLTFCFAPGRFQMWYPADVNKPVMLAYGVLGVVIQGCGASLFLIVRGPFRRRESGGWALLAAPLFVWFLADAAFLLYADFWQHAMLNLALLLLFAIPLTWRYFHAKAVRLVCQFSLFTRLFADYRE